MSDIQIVRMDEGGANARILAKETKTDFRRVEAASVKMRARFTSAEGKRFFVRLFNTQQLNAHFISVIARTKLDHDDVGKVELAIRSHMETVAEKLDRAIDAAEVLFKTHGITSAATYDTVPLDVEVGVISSSGRRYLELLGKLDQLMPLLQTLEIHEVMTPREVDVQRALLKRQVREVANGTRNLARTMRRRMSALRSTDARDEAGAASEASSDAELAEEGTDSKTALAASEGSGDAAAQVTEASEAH